MKAKTFNSTHIEGLLYQHNLTSRQTGPASKNPGVDYISGSVDIATDNAVTNIITVYFTYVTPTTAKGTPNATYTNLMNIINGTLKSVMTDGAANASKLRIDSAIGLNEFYADRNGTAELVSAKRNEGGFIHVVDTLNENELARNTFDLDMIITSVIHKEANEERNYPEKVVLKGTTFDFKKALLPIELSATHPDAINYFLNLEISPKNPLFTRVKGNQISTTVITTKEEPSAFGAPMLVESKTSRKDFVVTWAQTNPYEWDDETSITVKELTEKMAERETYLATIKKRQEDYKANKGNAIAQKPAITPAVGTFNF